MFLTLALASTLSAQQPSAPTTPPPPACLTPEHRQFDFWVGFWDVYRTGSDQMVAHSLIERRHSGCAIRENWMPFQGQGGGSFSAWRPESSVWRQTWVDSNGGWAEFTGGFADGAMVLTGHWWGLNGPGTEGLVRMRYTREAGGVVRQQGLISTDGGQIWAPLFDFTYRPSTPRSGPSG